MLRIRRSFRWTIPLLCAPVMVAAQGEQAGTVARVLTPATKHADAARRFTEGFDAMQALSFTVAARQLDEAVAADSTFGLARALRARTRGGPTLVAETQRAAIDAAGGSAAEATFALAIREAAAGRPVIARQLFDVAAALVPDDPRIAIEAANSRVGRERVAMLRDVAKRFPEFAPAKYWLAFHLTASPFGDIPKADLDEALATASEALRAAPTLAGSHVMMAHVLSRLGRDDEALTHVGHATTMADRSEAAYALRAEVATRRGDLAMARSALDSAAALSGHLGRAANYRRSRTLASLHEGNLKATIRDLEALARTDEGAGHRDAAAMDHLWLALMSGAARDNAAIARHLGEARRLGASGALLHDNEVITNYLAGNAAAARAALNAYREATASDTSAGRRESVNRLTGLVLIAEKKPREAIDMLKQGGPNPYSQLGLIEAYHALGDRKAAAAERAAFLARRNFSYNSTAVPIGRYRVKALKL